MSDNDLFALVCAVFVLLVWQAPRIVNAIGNAAEKTLERATRHNSCIVLLFALPLLAVLSWPLLAGWILKVMK
jgi:hypothetical protein